MDAIENWYQIRNWGTKLMDVVIARPYHHYGKITEQSHNYTICFHIPYFAFHKNHFYLSIKYAEYGCFAECHIISDLFTTSAIHISQLQFI